MRQTTMKSVDSTDSAGIPRVERAPHRKFEREASPIGTANPHEDMNPIAAAAANRIRANRHDRQVGSWLFGSDKGQVFVLSEDSACAGRMFRDHPQWVVGRYAAEASDHKRPKCPSAEHVFDDLRQHFVDLGFVGEPDIYAAVRGVEG